MPSKWWVAGSSVQFFFATQDSSSSQCIWNLIRECASFFLTRLAPRGRKGCGSGEPKRYFCFSAEPKFSVVLASVRPKCRQKLFEISRHFFTEWIIQNLYTSRIIEMTITNSVFGAKRKFSEKELKVIRIFYKMFRDLHHFKEKWLFLSHKNFGQNILIFGFGRTKIKPRISVEIFEQPKFRFTTIGCGESISLTLKKTLFGSHSWGPLLLSDIYACMHHWSFASTIQKGAIIYYESKINDSNQIWISYLRGFTFFLHLSSFM